MSLWILIPLLAVVGVLVFIASSSNSIFTSEVEIEVNAPLEHAFKIAMADEHMPEWLSSPQMKFEGIQRISGEENQIGSQYLMKFSGKGNKIMEMMETITSYEENKHFGMELNDKMFETKVDMYFEEENGKTIIREEVQGQGKTIILKAMMRLFEKKSREWKVQMYDKLKNIIERTYQEGLSAT